MTTNLLPLLTRLAEAAPEMCQKRNQYFVIGNYLFLDQGTGNGKILARLDMVRSDFCGGRPALAWLSDALESAIEARGWDYDTTYDSTGSHLVSIEGHTGNGSNKAEALLSALVAAVEAERVR